MISADDALPTTYGSLPLTTESGAVREMWVYSNEYVRFSKSVLIESSW